MSGGATFEDPNREAVGLDPIWTGTDTGTIDPPPEGGNGGNGGFVPGDHTVDEVKAYVEANPDQRSTVLAAEKRDKNRVTLVDWLSGSGG